ncbi:MAG: helix-turn-helix transcriptional regulator, partial [Clostridia bacterium]|nr:helix-turn-helix transcriptional regulator [Clostridia bacterium]
QYVNRLRLNYAKNLLLSSEKSIIDVALDSGFENVTYFNRCFKQESGLTPTEFRRQRPIHS